MSRIDDFASCRLVPFCFHFCYVVVFDSVITTDSFFKLISPFSFDLFDLLCYMRKRDFGLLLGFLQKKRKLEDKVLFCFRVTEREKKGFSFLFYFIFSTTLPRLNVDWCYFLISKFHDLFLQGCGSASVSLGF